MVLDLAALAFMGAVGLAVVSSVERRLAASGVTLTIRAPSALLNGIVSHVELEAESRLAQASPVHRHLGPELLGGTDVVSQGFGSSLSNPRPGRSG